MPLPNNTLERIWQEANSKYKEHGLIRMVSRREGYVDGATAEVERLQPVIDALTKFIARHEGGLLPDRFTYEKGVKALEQWKGMGKEEAKPTKIETCGHCGNQPASNYIGNQLYLCDECMEKHTEDCY